MKKSFLVAAIASVLTFLPYGAAIAQQYQNFKTFEDWCLNKNSLPLGTRLTIEKIVAPIGTKNCKLANNLLLQEDSISIFISTLVKIYYGNNYLERNVIPIDIRPISNLTQLKSLEVLCHPNTPTLGISIISSFTNLEDLTLSGCRIKDIKPLSRLSNLKRLDLSNNNISDIRPLSGLTNLKDLNLFDNKIIDIKALSNLTNLDSLRLSDNDQISDISPIRFLEKDWGGGLNFRSPSKIR